ncbi:MAG TPA: hypothetical protein VFV53_02735 [Candidatus Limnocylindrales bacterium]|nr:hypothetical protein [Candidatus Limnocylindrales bacterium]
MKRSTARSSWFAGLVIGTGGGFLLLEGPTLGLAILAAMAVLARLAGQAIAGAGGLLMGVGAIWIAALARVKLSCTVANGCEAPTIDGYLAVGAGFLALGTVASLVALARSRRDG